MARPAVTQPHMSTAPVRQRTYAETPRVNSNATVRNRNTANARVRTENARVTSRNRVESNVAVNRERNIGNNRARNFAANRDRNARFNQGSNVRVNRNRNIAVTNNWRGNQFTGRNYAVFRNYHRQWHDRGWWRDHFSRIVFVGGGWWYWDAGYWFPAWGYDPYAYYPYDGPIYGYSNLTPYQVVSEVQAQLQADGYYAGPIDGVLGPMTRQAIAAFQADHGLAITSTVDEPTMNTLGIS
jgi:Putative peptidoglycan binding domain